MTSISLTAVFNCLSKHLVYGGELAGFFLFYIFVLASHASTSSSDW